MTPERETETIEKVEKVKQDLIHLAGRVEVTCAQIISDIGDLLEHLREDEHAS
jgi:hypothetical protein